MKILIVGAGGREHAITWKISENPRVSKIFAAPGNAYNKMIKNCENVNISKTEDILNFAETEKIDLTIVGSEELLVDGIVDKFHEKNLRIFGPDKKVAMLEGSKAFAKDFMEKYGVRTAKYKSFTEKEKALEFLKEMNYPVVVKASGLAAGKGVVICQNKVEAHKALDEIMTDKIFAAAGDTVVVEEFLDGVEVSILSITDSKVILPFLSAKDHKKISEGEQGLNTGGMGVISPNPYYTKEIEEKFIKDILKPTLNGIKEEKFDFCGIIFFGLMICEGEVYLLEYNMRMGDPETQAVLPLMESDYLDLLEKAIDRKLENTEIKWKSGASCCVVLAAGGYPLSYEKGNEIKGFEKFENNSEARVFLAGVKNEADIFKTNGGRVLNVVSVQENVEKAREIAYRELEKIEFKDKYFRRDIGLIK
ncbi:MAG: phosphoribosylamine--glycine ligase [Fusobacterium sp.]|nr:phosphoribosylamine--glycine ligase [Fusobacterium sp.]